MIIFYGEPSAEFSSSLEEIRPDFLESCVIATEWSTFERCVAEAAPSLAIISFGAFAEGGPSAAIETHEFLLEREIPSIVLISEGSTQERRIAELVAGFKIILEPPFIPAELEKALTNALNPAEFVRAGLSESGDYSAVTIADIADRGLGEEEEEFFDQEHKVGDTDQVGHPVIGVPRPPTGSEEVQLDMSELPPDPPTAEPVDSEPAPYLGEAEDEGEVSFGDSLEVRDWTDTVYSPPPTTDQGRENRVATPVADTPVSLEPAAPAEPTSTPVAHAKLAVKLPTLIKGKLNEVPALRLVFGHHVLGHTGRLVLKMGRISREIAFKDGVPGLLDLRIIDPATRNRVIASLVWSSGRYSFFEEPVRANQFCPFGDILEIVHSAIHQGMSLNQVLTPLSGSLKRFPVVTTRVQANSESVAVLPGVAQFLNRCGTKNLEGIAGTMTDAMETSLKNALFCDYAGLIAFLDEPMEGPVELSYEAVDRWQVPSEPLPKPSQTNDDEIMQVLTEQVRRFQTATPHELFSVQEGCGRRAVQEAYYQLVKDHHPDAYALARSPEVQPMAEMLFRMIRDAYANLLKLEKSDQPSPAPTADARDTLDDSSASGAGHSYAYGRGETTDHSGSTRIPDELRRQARETPKPRNQKESTPRPEERRTVVGKRDPRQTSQGRSRRRGPSTTQRRRLQQTGTGRLMASIKSDVGVDMDPRQLFKTGTTLLGSGSNSRALQTFKKALDQDESNATYLAHYAWAMYLVDNGDVGKATKLLKDAVRLAKGSDLEWPALFLGHLYMAEGNPEDGVENYRKALTANPGNIEAKRRLRLHDMRNKGTGSFLDKLFSKSKKKKGSGNKSTNKKR